MYYASYPNSFQFLEVLKSIQIDIYVEMRSVNAINRRRENTEKEVYVKNVIFQFENTKIIHYVFIQKLAFKNLTRNSDPSLRSRARNSDKYKLCTQFGCAENYRYHIILESEN